MDRKFQFWTHKVVKAAKKPQWSEKMNKLKITTFSNKVLHFLKIFEELLDI